MDVLRYADGTTFGFTESSQLTALFASLKQEQQLKFAYETAQDRMEIMAFSLSGLAAALLWIDEKQNRIGRSQSISYPAGVDGDAKFTASKEILDQLRRLANNSECEPEGMIESYRLPGGLALHTVECFLLSHATSSLLFVEEEKGTISKLDFADYDDGWTGTDILPNIRFESKTSRLQSYYRSVPRGGCGTIGQWVWSGYVFKLLEFRSWTDCYSIRNEADWPIIYKRQAK